MPNNGARILRTIATALGLAVTIGAGPVLAQTAPGSSLSLTVSPLVVEFHAGAGETTTANVTVHNGGNDPERIIALRMDWRVAADGTVRVEQPGAEKAASIADDLRMEPADVQLAPGETRELALTLDLPANFPTATAVYHSGFLIRAVPLTGVVNFGPAATVVVYDTVGTPATHVTLSQLHVGSSATGTATLAARIVNDGVAYARMSGRIVLRQNGTIVADQTSSIPVLFAGETRAFTKTLSDLAPGAYDMTFTLDYGGPTLIQATSEIHVR
jgi:hypothetical protein